MTTQRTILNWLLVYLLVFMSGSLRYNFSDKKYLVLGFLVAVTAWYLFTDRKISDRFLLFSLVFFGFLFSLSLYTGGGITLPSILGGLMKLVIAYLILKTVDSDFVSIFIKLIVFLAVVSLFGNLSDKFNLFDGLIRKLPPVGEMGYEGLLYVFRFPWHIGRNNSIFFEPGAYQGFLNAALFLLAFTETSINSRTRWIFIVILGATLITTFSTTGFVMFGVMFPVFLYKSRIATFSAKIKIVAAILAVVAVFSAQFYSTFVVKMATYIGGYEREAGVKVIQISGAANRAEDYRTDLKIFSEHIFGIGYEQYAKEFSSRRQDVSVDGGSTALRRDLSTDRSSNGITSTLAVNGLPFALFLFGSYYWALRRLLGDFLLANLAFGMIMLFLWGEGYYVGAPIIYAVVAGAFVLERKSAPRAPGGELADSAERHLR